MTRKVPWGKHPTELQDRLFAHREIDSNGCWNWMLHIMHVGYGHIRIGSDVDGTRKTVRVHRLAAHLWKGFDLNSKLQVLHHCDNRKCFNPDHLFIGTHSDNMADCSRKGRISNGSMKAQWPTQ